LKDATADVVDQASRTAEAQASRTLARAGDTLGQVANVVRDASDGLRSEQPQLADLAELAAGQVERASTYLRDHDARDLVATTESFARRQPAIVVGAALIAGLALGRLLRSTSSATGGSGGYGGYGGSMAARTGNGYASAPSAAASGSGYGSSPRGSFESSYDSAQGGAYPDSFGHGGGMAGGMAGGAGFAAANASAGHAGSDGWSSGGGFAGDAYTAQPESGIGEAAWTGESAGMSAADPYVVTASYAPEQHYGEGMQRPEFPGDGEHEAGRGA